MTRMQEREHSPSITTLVVGSYADEHSYAMRYTSAAATAANLNNDNHHHHHHHQQHHQRHHNHPRHPHPQRSSPPTELPDKTPSNVPQLVSVYSIQASDGARDTSGSRMGAINPVAEELHPSEMSEENSITESHRSSDSGNSTSRVDFTDIGGEESFNFTTNTLRKCKHQVLKPYWFLLMFIGWRVFRHDVITRGWFLRLVNLIYPILVIVLLFYTYTYEMIACEWKLDVTHDTLILTSPRPTTSSLPNHTSTVASISWIKLSPPNTSQDDLSDDTPTPCEHIVSTYLIPNLLHFVAYVMGFYYFRIQDNEQMYALMEKVFLQANPLHKGSSSQEKLVYKTRLFLAFGLCWVLLTLGLQGLYVWAFDFPRLQLFERYGLELHWIMFSIELVGRVVFNSVLLAVVINYVTQCEMVMFYVRGLTLRLQEKSADIKTAFKDTLLLRQNLSQLNGVISRMTTMALVILAELTVIGLSILALNRYDVPKVWAYRSIFPLIWGIMLCFPLFQAARVNSVCLRIRKISQEMRVFGYKNSSQLELDSFLQFVHHTQLRAKLFHVPIHPSYLMALSILGAFIFLVLVQTSNVVPKNDII